MKRFMVAVIAVVFVFVTGVSYGQNPPQMPEKVRNTLGKLIGTWSVSTEPVSKVTFRWAPGKYYVIMNGEFETEAGKLTSSGLMSWDGVSEDKMIMSLVGPAGYSIEHIRIVSETVSEGEATGSMLGKKDSSKSKYVFQGPDKFTSYTTNEIVGGERQPDSTTVFTRVKRTSDEKVLVDLSDQWSKALLNQDAGALDRILSDDFILSNPDAVKTKNEIVDSIKSGDLVVTLCDYSDAAIRIYGDVAIIQGVGKESGQYKGKKYSGSNRFTDVFLKREDQWQCIATHISKIATNENSIEGMWESEKVTGGPVDLEGYRSLKAYSNGTWFFTYYNLQSGEAEVIGGGTYSFDGITLKERITFAGGDGSEELLGLTPTYNIEFKDGKIHQTGELLGMHSDQLWRRVGK